MSGKKRSVFFISDGTGITAEALGHSLLTQFEDVQFIPSTLPFVDSVTRAEQCVAKINNAYNQDGAKPLVFSTLINSEISQVVKTANALFIDFFETFISPLELELEHKSSHTIGRTHSLSHRREYDHRIEAVNFALAHDDGLTTTDLQKADVILVGVSRSGKTPTSLYLALQFGIMAANFPLIPEDFERMSLPKGLPKARNKLFGLSINPERLQQIRQERRPNSKYSSLANCRYEVEKAEELMRREGIRWLNSTVKSIEEIATTLMQEMHLERRVY